MSHNLRKLINQYQEIITPLILFAASGALILFGILPAAGRIADLWGSIGGIRESIKFLSDKEALLASQDEAGLQHKLQVLVSAIPEDKSLPSILSLMDGLSAGSGVTFESLELSGGTLATASAKLSTSQEKALGASILPFTVNVSGSLSGILDFISQATEARRLVRFKNFNVSLGASSSATLRATLEAYYTPLPAVSAAAQQSLPVLTAQDNAVLDKLSAFAWLSQPPATQLLTVSGKINPFAH